MRYIFVYMSPRDSSQWRSSVDLLSDSMQELAQLTLLRERKDQKGVGSPEGACHDTISSHLNSGGMETVLSFALNSRVWVQTLLQSVHGDSKPQDGWENVSECQEYIKVMLEKPSLRHILWLPQIELLSYFPNRTEHLFISQQSGNSRVTNSRACHVMAYMLLAPLPVPLQMSLIDHGVLPHWAHWTTSSSELSLLDKTYFHLHSRIRHVSFSFFHLVWIQTRRYYVP